MHNIQGTSKSEKNHIFTDFMFCSYFLLLLPKNVFSQPPGAGITVFSGG